MKDSFFEMLMNFFEKSLSQIKESNTQSTLDQALPFDESETHQFDNLESRTIIVRPAKEQAIRVFTVDEQLKLTKASYQFIMRMILWGVIASEIMEQVLNQLLFSESRFVTLQETKWTIRNTLSEYLDKSQLAFLDLVLYQKEDGYTIH